MKIHCHHCGGVLCRSRRPIARTTIVIILHSIRKASNYRAQSCHICYPITHTIPQWRTNRCKTTSRPIGKGCHVLHNIYVSASDGELRRDHARCVRPVAQCTCQAHHLFVLHVRVHTCAQPCTPNELHQRGWTSLSLSGPPIKSVERTGISTRANKCNAVIFVSCCVGLRRERAL